MTKENKFASRLQFLARVVRKECQHLTATDRHLFVNLFTIEQATRLKADHDLAERISGLKGGPNPLIAKLVGWCCPNKWITSTERCASDV